MNVYAPGNNIINVTEAWGVSATDEPSDTVALHVLYNHPTRWPGTQFQQENVGAFNFVPAKNQKVLLTSGEPYNLEDIESWIQQQNFEHYAIALGSIPNIGWQDRPGWFYRSWWLPYFLRQNSNNEPVVLHNSPMYMFDALLGARRPHRDFVMQCMIDSNMLEQSIVTYRDCFQNHSVTTPPAFEWPYVSANLDPAWEVDNVNHQTSHQTPWEIYRRTKYSIVCETIGDGMTFFLSEKTMKVLWAERVFVMFGVQHFLARLHDLGFETFGDIIDESYDSIAVPQQRWAAAWRSSQQLAHLNVEEVYAATQARRQRNRQRLKDLEVEFQQTAQLNLKSLTMR